MMKRRPRGRGISLRSKTGKRLLKHHKSSEIEDRTKGGSLSTEEHHSKNPDKFDIEDGIGEVFVILQVCCYYFVAACISLF